MIDGFISGRRGVVWVGRVEMDGDGEGEGERRVDILVEILWRWRVEGGIV